MLLFEGSLQSVCWGLKSKWVVILLYLVLGLFGGEAEDINKSHVRAAGLLIGQERANEKKKIQIPQMHQYALNIFKI